MPVNLPLPHSCNHPKCFQTLPNVPWEEKSLGLRAVNRQKGFDGEGLLKGSQQVSECPVCIRWALCNPLPSSGLWALLVFSCTNFRLFIRAQLCQAPLQLVITSAFCWTFSMGQMLCWRSGHISFSHLITGLWDGYIILLLSSCHTRNGRQPGWGPRTLVPHCCHSVWRCRGLGKMRKKLKYQESPLSTEATCESRPFKSYRFFTFI